MFYILKLFFIFFVTYFLFCLVVFVIDEIWGENDDHEFGFDLLSEYECGFDPFDDATRQPFDVHYYIVGIIFLIFDVEIACIFPWVFDMTVYDMFSIFTFLFFLFILTLGFLYEWYVGALEWPHQAVTKVKFLPLFISKKYDIADKKPFLFNIKHLHQKFNVFAYTPFLSFDNNLWFESNLSLDFFLFFSNSLYFDNFINSFKFDFKFLVFELFFSELFIIFMICLNVFLFIYIKNVTSQPYQNINFDKYVYRKFVLTSGFYFKKDIVNYFELFLQIRNSIIILRSYLVIFCCLFIFLANEAWCILFSSNYSLKSFFLFFSKFFYLNNLFGLDFVTSKNIFFLLILTFFIIILFFILISSKVLLDKLKIPEFCFFLVNLFFFLFCGIKSCSFIMTFLNFVGFSLSSYLIFLTDTKNKLSREACVKYYYLSAICSSFFASGVFIVFKHFGSVEYGTVNLMGYYLIENSTSISYSVYTSILLILASFLFKLGAFPGHWWLPDIYNGFNYVFIIISTVLLKFSVFVILLYILHDPFSSFFFLWQTPIAISVIGSVFFGAIFTLNELKLKKFIALSSISQVGFSLSGVLYFSMAGFASSLFYMILYVFTNLVFLTFCVLIVCERNVFLSTSLKYTKSISNLFKPNVIQSHYKPKAISNIFQSPLLRFINQNSIGTSRELIYFTDLYKAASFNKIYRIYFFILLLSLAGIPPLAGFVGKFYLLSTSVFFDKFLVIFFLLLSSLFSAFYYLRVVTIISSEQKFFVSYTKQKKQLPDLVLSFVVTSPLSQFINTVLLFIIYINVLELCSEKNLSVYSKIGHFFFS